MSAPHPGEPIIAGTSNDPCFTPRYREFFTAAIRVGLGSIETGKWADLVVLRGNPLADIRATRDPRIVIKAGRVYDPVVLGKSVEGKLGPARAADTTAWLGASTRTP